MDTTLKSARSSAGGGARLDALSDGVFAIAATLLVLDLKVPEGAESGHGLGGYLATQWPAYTAFVASFLVIGVIWINHHAVLALAPQIDHPLQVLNLLMLLTVSVIPFPTALLAHYATGPHSSADRRVAVLVYGATMALMTVAFNALWRRVKKDAERLPGAEHDVIRRRHRRFNAGLVLYPAVTVVGLFSVPAFLAGLVALAGLYLLPNGGARNPTRTGWPGPAKPR